MATLRKKMKLAAFQEKHLKAIEAVEDRMYLTLS